MENKTIKTTAFSKNKAGEFFKTYGAVVGMFLLLIVFQIFDNRFLQPANLWGICKNSAFLILMALGMTFALSVRGIDFSIAQVADAAAVISAFLILKDVPPMMALLLTLLFGLFIGLSNALLMAYLGVPALIGTLGTMFIVRSFELVLTNGAQPQVLFTMPRSVTGTFLNIGQGSVLGLPNVMLIGIVAIVVIYFVRERSVLGRHMDAINGNVRSAFLSGIDIRKTFAAAFILSALLAAVAGILICSRAGSATPRATESYLNDCFVAVYIGTLLSKDKRFNVLGTVIGCLFVGCISNFFTLMGMGNGIKQLCNGFFILMAVMMGTAHLRKKN